MSKIIDGMEPGQISDVQMLPFGCIVLQLVDRRSYEPVSLDQAREELQQELWERYVSEKYSEWMEKLRENTYIERKGYFADAAQFFSTGPDGGEGQATGTP